MTAKTILLASVALMTALPALADTSDKRIALSNNYAGNSWRQAMLTSWETITGPAVESGVVAAADAFTTAENQASLIAPFRAVGDAALTTIASYPSRIMFWIWAACSVA